MHQQWPIANKTRVLLTCAGEPVRTRLQLPHKKINTMRQESIAARPIVAHFLPPVRFIQIAANGGASHRRSRLAADVVGLNLREEVAHEKCGWPDADGFEHKRCVALGCGEVPLMPDADRRPLPFPTCESKDHLHLHRLLLLLWPLLLFGLPTTTFPAVSGCFCSCSLRLL